MRDLRANTKKMWYSLYGESVPEVDENGDYTGETSTTYSTPIAFRANISATKASSESATYDVFGSDLDYQKVISTAKPLPFDEQTLIWATQPSVDDDGLPDRNTADYQVVAVGDGLYQNKYAVRKLHQAGDAV